METIENSEVFKMTSCIKKFCNFEYDQSHAETSKLETIFVVLADKNKMYF